MVIARCPRIALVSIAAALFVLAALAAACGDDSKPSLARSTTAGTQPPAAAGGVSQLTTTIRAGTAQGTTGAEVQVEVQALGLGAPGLGAWQLNVAYDPAIVTPTDCETAGTAACNLAFESDTVRLAGATGQGLQGDVTLMTLTFTCNAAGTSPLTVTPDLLADGTIGGPLTIEDPTVEAGSLTCT